ncbi:MAG: DUF4402 domain-containing protein [Saprospirales bacterium]|nr:MAG: DUF4402 domain-containing protein [Saprospirales bacterium]
MLVQLPYRFICPAIIAITFLFSNQIAAQSGVIEVHTTAFARVSVPLQLDKSSDMGFGLIAANNGGEVTLNFDGTREVTSGDVAFIPGQTGDVHAAAFEAKGHPHSDVQILFPTTMEISNGSETMSLTLLSSVGTSANLFDNPPANRLFFEMGAVLEIGPDQEPGEYEGTFSISVVYE